MGFDDDGQGPGRTVAAVEACQRSLIALYRIPPPRPAEPPPRHAFVFDERYMAYVAADARGRLWTLRFD